MKLLFLFLNILAISLNANEIYYDEDNTFLNVKPGKEFLQKYFYKPLNTQQKSIIDFEIISISRIENIQEICNIFKMHYDKKQDACFDDYGVKFCELKTAKEMQDYMLKFIEIPVKLGHSNYSLGRIIYVALVEKLKRLDIFGILKSGVVVWNLLEKLTKRYSLLTRILLEHIGKAR